MISNTLPEPGQLVVVRQRRFVVSEVNSGSTSGVLKESLINAFTHLVTLSSVEDDALGEQLQVVWELESGTHVFAKSDLPKPNAFDNGLYMKAFLNAVRWGTVSSADASTLQSPFRSGIEIEDYQLDPVVRALRMPRANLLIADDVGLGKTIESGIVLKELVLRNRAHTVLIVCPSSLQIQWQEQMRDKFGLEFRIVDSDLMHVLRRTRGIQVNPWTHFPRLITSIDYIKRDRPMRLYREVLPSNGEPTYPRRFDLLIVDEAHNIAPSGSGHYALDSQRTLAIRTIIPHFEHRLFLTATPHNGYHESFGALLELLDNQRFARGVKPRAEQLHAVMVRRLKSELPPNWDGTTRFPKRKIQPLEVEYTKPEKEIHQVLHRYTQLRQSAANSDTEKYAAEFVLKLLKKRLFSSPAAFASTFKCHMESLSNKKGRAERRLAQPTLGVLRRRLEELQEDFSDDEKYEEGSVEAVESATELLFPPSDEEQKLLKALNTYADTAAQPDTKVNTLVEWLNSTLRPKGQWNDERVLIFTEYRTTQKWLHGLLAAHGFARDGRLAMMYGGMDTKSREQVKNAFQAKAADSPVRILLATDAASEGIDLQNHCYRLVHYEIPWNLNRMEQRNGRLDRHGQKSSEVLIHHFVGKGYDEADQESDLPVGELTGDLEFLMRAVIKVENIREDLGKVGPVIASQVEDAMLGRRTRLNTKNAEEEAKIPKAILKQERNLRDQIAKLRDQLNDTRLALELSPESIQSAVEVALKLAGQPPLTEATLSEVWPDPTGKRVNCPVFTLPALTGSWARCSEGLEHPHTHKVRPITFDQTLITGRDDIVLIHLNHRLAAMSLRLLRAEIWATDHRQQLYRVSTCLLPNSISNTPVVIAHGRLVVLGGDNQRLHEELIASGGAIDEGRFRRLNVSQVKQVLETGLAEDAPAHVQQKLKGLWDSIEKPLYQSLEARTSDRTAGLQKFLEERRDLDIKNITAVMEELAQTIRDELKAPEHEQIELWTDPEREQLERNRNSLAERLKAIPAELAQEVKAITERYANPTSRLFPVAVTFYVPEKLARSAGGGH
ncbi:MAG: DEAD/DEAH box helicase family protein [bacterium]|nr:DEAD/DEAH box helicase family protein [bacterium]